MKTKKILVTGGTGYIGSHTVVELLAADCEVVIIDDLSNSEIAVLNGIEKISGQRPHFEQIDLTDQEKVDVFFAKNADIDAIIHFAAYKAVGESVNHPLKYYTNNLNSLTNVLRNMEKHNIQGLVFSSSCTVYGQPDKLPVDENAPIKKAESPYGNTKQVAEDIIQDFIHAEPHLKGIALRYFNPVGAHESALIGELPLGVPNNLVPFITQTAAGIREELKIFGDDYPTPDGTAIRDYIHVVDLARAHVVAVNRILEEQMKSDFEFFNLGTGMGYSVLDVVKAFEKSTGVPLSYSVAPRRAGDIVQIWSDTKVANKELGWEAKKGIEEMMFSAWKWQEHLMEQ